MFLSNEINDLSEIYFFLLFSWMYGMDRNCYLCISILVIMLFPKKTYLFP